MRAISMLLGFIMDMIIGDPQRAPHPVRAIGALINLCDKKLNKGSRLQRRLGGVITLIIVWTVTAIGVALAYIIPMIIVMILHYQGILYNGRLWMIIVYILVDSILFYYSIAATDLRREAMDVYKALKYGDIFEARRRLSMIVGRDTERLDEEGVVKATVETVAENAGDGVVSPIIYFALFGSLGAWLFKATSTMDSMIGYKNDKYQYFGTAGARMDDVLNYIPARITAILIILYGPMVANLKRRKKIDRTNDCRSTMKKTAKVYTRFNKCSPSPNSAHPESAMAGALNIRLGGPAWYKGILHEKPYIGDGDEEIELSHIKISCGILLVITSAMLLICVGGILLYTWISI